VIVVLDEARDLGFEITGQVIVLEQNAVLERLVQRSILLSASMKRSTATIPQQPTGGVRPNARQNDQINPSTTIPTTPGTGSRPQLASMLREGRKSANIHLRSGVIWGIPD
jgi:hypothetical protein